MTHITFFLKHPQNLHNRSETRKSERAKVQNLSLVVIDKPHHPRRDASRAAGVPLFYAVLQVCDAQNFPDVFCNKTGDGKRADTRVPRASFWCEFFVRKREAFNNRWNLHRQIHCNEHAAKKQRMVLFKMRILKIS